MFKIGEMLRLRKKATIQGKKIAIMAWEWKKQGIDFFSGNVPKDSNDYDSWLEHISNSVGYCLETDQEWVRIQFMNFQTPFWIHSSKLESCI